MFIKIEGNWEYHVINTDHIVLIKYSSNNKKNDEIVEVEIYLSDGNKINSKLEMYYIEEIEKAIQAEIIY